MSGDTWQRAQELLPAPVGSWIDTDSVISASDAAAAFQDGRDSFRRRGWRTGFDRVDQVSGGFALGQVWVVTGSPGQGRSTMATQWALLLAARHSQVTHLVSRREPLELVTARLLSSAKKIPVSHLRDHELTPSDASRLQGAREILDAAPLQLAGPGMVSLLDGGHRTGDRPHVLIVDDADLSAGATPARVTAISEQGVLVILTLPRTHVFDQSGIDPDWARAADVILEIRRPDHLDWESLRPGEADLCVVRNRWGPQLLTTVAFQGHYARFVEMAR